MLYPSVTVQGESIYHTDRHVLCSTCNYTELLAPHREHDLDFKRRGLVPMQSCVTYKVPLGQRFMYMYNLLFIVSVLNALLVAQ